MKTNKLTKKQKEEWLTALKSGDYTQVEVYLKSRPVHLIQGNCCLGVLCLLNNITIGDCNLDEKAYDWLHELLGSDIVGSITKVNDNVQYWIENPDKRDYSNVIPLIEQLETID